MKSALQPLEDRNATLFLIAGGLLVVFAVLLGVEGLTGGSTPEDVFGPPGFAIAALGLLGLYPALAERSRWLAGIGAVAAAIASVGWAVLTVLSILELAGVSGMAAPEETVFGAVALGATGLGMLLGYPLIAIATLRSDEHPRTLGLLLLAPPVIFVSVFAVLAPILGDSGGWGPFIAASAQAVAHLAIGFTLRGETQAAGSFSRPDEPVTA